MVMEKEVTEKATGRRNERMGGRCGWRASEPMDPVPVNPGRRASEKKSDGDELVKAQPTRLLNPAKARQGCARSPILKMELEVADTSLATRSWPKMAKAGGLQ
jgi:hypothetical protein